MHGTSVTTFPGLFLSSSSKLNWNGKGVNTSNLAVSNIDLGAHVTSCVKKTIFGNREKDEG